LIESFLEIHECPKSSKNPVGKKEEICMDMLLKTPLNPLGKIRRKYSIL
jgi:hypothetical protein